ncbi:hypothetical protein CQ13_29730 [Bradyrhizobium retamae]|uniref:Uncharacterized protein n=1 Tax=Bradyrhizobium retamae TaxID=1300035 RepID=A0A0R3MQY2_9BRAD|nr:hypothetical protein CQ13_29730 [Bradyrhizobium retamae]
MRLGDIGRLPRTRQWYLGHYLWLFGAHLWLCRHHFWLRSVGDDAGELFLACVEPLGERLAFARHLDLARFDLLDDTVVACHFLMARLELARDIFIVADQLFLPHIELFYRLPQGSEIARHGLELLRQVGRHGDGIRRCVFDGSRCGF